MVFPHRVLPFQSVCLHAAKSAHSVFAANVPAPQESTYPIRRPLHFAQTERHAQYPPLNLWQFAHIRYRHWGQSQVKSLRNPEFAMLR